MKKPLLDLAISVKLPLKNGKVLNWQVLDLANLIQYYCTRSELYRLFMRHAFEAYGRPFHAQIHEDEITPGNIMMNRRKTHAWYVSFREFGLHIRNESSWLCFATLQSNFVSRVQGGFSCVTRCLYQSLIEHVQTNSLLRAGIAVDVGGEHRLLLICA